MDRYNSGVKVNVTKSVAVLTLDENWYIGGYE